MLRRCILSFFTFLLFTFPLHGAEKLGPENKNHIDPDLSITDSNGNRYYLESWYGTFDLGIGYMRSYKRKSSKDHQVDQLDSDDIYLKIAQEDSNQHSENDLKNSDE